MLAAGASDTHSTTVHVPPSILAGTYYVLAKADFDAAVTESSEANNLKVSNAIGIGPDLIVSTVTAPASGVAGGPLTVSDTTKNQGGGVADSSIMRFYLSANSLLDASDVVIGSRIVQEIENSTEQNVVANVGKLVKELRLAIDQ